MNKATEDYLNQINKLQGDENGRRNFRLRLESGNAYWNHRVASASYMPVCLTMEDRQNFIEDSEVLYSILVKVIRRYRKDPDFRREFHFDKRVEEMILFPTAYDEALPLMRTDSIYDPANGKMYYCEFNTDASGGMTETFETISAIRESEPYRCFAGKYDVLTDEESVFGKWAHSLTYIWKSSLSNTPDRPDSPRISAEYYPPEASVNLSLSETRGSDDPSETSGDNDLSEISEETGLFGFSSGPRLAIVVCFDSPDPDTRELDTFIPYFEAEGFQVSIFDVRELKYANGKLTGIKALKGESNVEIDVIWRFCIVSDLLEHWEEVQDFISAMKAGAVPLIGGLFTQIVADKQVFAILGKYATDEMFTPDEWAYIREHIPFTAYIDDLINDNIRQADHAEINLMDVITNRNKWILKPTDLYASRGVVSGRSCTETKWTELIEKCLQDGSRRWLVQEFIEPVRSPSIPIYGDDSDYLAEPSDYGCIYGTYIYCGKYAGVYLRQGPEDVIGDARGGVTSEVLWCEEASDDPVSTNKSGDK